jgi:ABC-2 type transport system permease protein
MRLAPAYGILLRQYYLISGSIARFLPLFIWVALDMILWGFLTKYLNAITENKMNFVPLFLGAILLWDFLVRVMQGITISFFEDVWSKNLLNVFATPLRTSEYLLGLVVTSILTSMVGLVAMLLLSTLVFGLSFASYGIYLIPFIFILFLFGIGLGILCTAMVLRLGPASEWFVWPIPALISPFTGVFYPLSTLPEWMRVVSYGLPPSYVFEGMRQILDHGSFPHHLLFTGLALAIFYILLASWVFQKTFFYAIRTGLIARYSAESVS